MENNVKAESSSDIDFSLFCRNTLHTHAELIQKWVDGTDPFKRALGKLISESGRDAQ